MTVTVPPEGVSPAPVDLVTVTIDGYEVSVPKGTLVIRAAEQLGISVPRFCDHPLLDPVGACRQCLVEIGMPDRTHPTRTTWMPKPQASCTITVAPGMTVRTQLTSSVADKAQQGVMEFLLMNHPLDCPVCDKGGECPLQNQAMSNGRPESRYAGHKRTFPKPLAISAQVLLDRERCVLCARCTRFSKEIAGDPFIDMLERGALQQVGIYEKEPFDSYFSGNTIQICPVGALTSQAYRFRARPFDLVSVPTACEHCASGCALRTDYRRGKVMRRLAWNAPEVNEEWNCDKGRFAFAYAQQADRLTHPLVRDASGSLVVASWPEALDIAAQGLAAAVRRGGVGVLPGGRVTVEDAYAYGKFARVVLGTNDVDFRARAHSTEEEAFLAASVAGSGLGLTYQALEAAPVVLLVGLEPEDESPIVFLRLRKAVRKRHQRVFAISPLASRALSKLSGVALLTAPGAEAAVLDDLASGTVLSGPLADTAEGLGAGGAVILLGERLAISPGALSAALRLATATGARLAWIPRRAGERGALEAGALPSLLPGGRPVSDPAARADVGAVWGVSTLPAAPGRDTSAMLTAALRGSLGGLLVGGVDLADLPDPDAARAAVQAAGFVVSLEQRPSQVSDLADVVLPVAPVAEKAGSFTNWEGRTRTFDTVLAGSAMADGRVLAGIAAAMGAHLTLDPAQSARAELAELGAWDGERVVAPALPAPPAPSAGAGHAVLASWRLLLDGGRLLDGEPYLAATARPAALRLSATAAERIGASNGSPVTVTTPSGSITLPLEVAAMPDDVVWVPTAANGTRIQSSLAAGPGDVVRLSAGAAS